MDSNTVLLAFGLTLFAGLSTGIGGLLTLFWDKTKTRLLSVILGFSAGVMIYVSFMEILPEAHTLLTEVYGNRAGSWAALASFLGGIAVIALIDRLVPESRNPHESRKVEEMGEGCGTGDMVRRKKLLRTGLFTATAIAIHNFPEGIASFTAVIREPATGAAIAIAIAIHNIPEGISVAIPVYCATGNRMRGFVMSFLSGLSEPAGALIGYLILFPFLNDTVFGILFAAVAGIMIFISFDELLPTAREYGEHHYSITGLVAGMVVMAVSLILIT